MKLQDLETDEGILEELGKRLSRARIDRNRTQAELAKEVGIGKRTLERLEAGETVQADTLIRVLRALGLLEALNGAIPELEIRPRYAVKNRGRVPKRVRHGRVKEAAPWAWGDEK